MPFTARTTLVGRDREQVLLRDHLTAALAGHGGVVLIGGESGIGKTALAEGLCQEASAHAAVVLVGRCYDLNTWEARKGSNVTRVVTELNPIIRGWATYYRTMVASRAFSDLDSWMFTKERNHTRYAHPTKPWYWRKRQYWGQLNPRWRDNWVFGDKHSGHYLLKFAWFKIQRHVMVKGRSSPDAPRLRDYWTKRAAAQSNALATRKQKIARIQNHVCPLCGESIHNGEEIHEHHVYGRTHDAVILVHLYCHQQIHSQKESSEAAA